MMMGLRLVQEGVGEMEFQERFGTTLEAEFSPVIERLHKRGLLKLDHRKAPLELDPPGAPGGKPGVL